MNCYRLKRSPILDGCARNDSDGDIGDDDDIGDGDESGGGDIHSDISTLDSAPSEYYTVVEIVCVWDCMSIGQAWVRGVYAWV